MNSGKRKSITGNELIDALTRDPFYGVKHIRADTGETYVEDSNSVEQILNVRSDQDSDKSKKRQSGSEYDPSLVVIHEVDSEETKSILNSIYKDRPTRQIFRNRFKNCPFKSYLLPHLIFAWCGLLGLPYTRNGQSPDNQELDILKNWSMDFEIKLKNLKKILRNNNWPLPFRLFEQEPDNTRYKVNLSDKAFKRHFREQVELLPQLKKRRKEIRAIQPESMEADEKKQQEIVELNNQIAILTKSKPSLSKNPSPMTKREKGKLATKIRNEGWRREKKRMKEDNSNMFKSDIAKRICKAHNKLLEQAGEEPLEWKTISRLI